VVFAQGDNFVLMVEIPEFGIQLSSTADKETKKVVSFRLGWENVEMVTYGFLLTNCAPFWSVFRK